MSTEARTDPAVEAPAAARPVDRIWEKFGSTDPYYGVLSEPLYENAGATAAATPSARRA